MFNGKIGDRVVTVSTYGESGHRGRVVHLDADPQFPIQVKFDVGGSGLLAPEELSPESDYDKGMEISSLTSSLQSEIMESRKGEAVDHPSHYAEGWSNGAEVIDITEHLNFNRGNACKYLARAGKKGGPEKELEDLQKALWYVRREVGRLGGQV